MNQNNNQLESFLTRIMPYYVTRITLHGTDEPVLVEPKHGDGMHCIRCRHVCTTKDNDYNQQRNYYLWPMMISDGGRVRWLHVKCGLTILRSYINESVLANHFTIVPGGLTIADGLWFEYRNFHFRYSKKLDGRATALSDIERVIKAMNEFERDWNDDKFHNHLGWRTENAMSQLDRYGGSVADENVASLLDYLTMINDDLCNGTASEVVRRHMDGMRKAMDAIDKALTEDDEYWRKQGLERKQ